ncbi:MAG: uroporphyrinogen decarboxylase family protein [Armatimonadota bacterium]
MTKRENILKTVRFETPDYIPMIFSFNPACWNHYPKDALFELMSEHHFLFPDFDANHPPVPYYGPQQRAGQPYTDGWGCVWKTTKDGISGSVAEHPLESWDAFDGYTPPDPALSCGLEPRDWNQIASNLQKVRSNGELTSGSLNHGHTFLLMCDLRGYQNLLFDMIDQDPRLYKLLGVIEDFNLSVVTRFLELGIEWMSYPEDLGMQIGPMISPELFRRFIKPSYQRIMEPARKAGCIVHMHSDGDIRSLAADLVDGGVQVLNLQDLVNGIDWIVENFAGKVCIDLDIDRQTITPNGTPQQIDALIREEVENLSTKNGGLMMLYGLYPGVPLENVKVLMDAMERYAFYYA